MLGQNFFRSADRARRFAAQLADGGEATIVEVGPGSGMITRVLAERGVPVTAVEIDPHWAARIEEDRLPGVTVVRADFLRWAPKANKIRIIGNLPFGSGTQILRRCLELGPHRLDQAVLLLQGQVVAKRAGRWGGNLFNVEWMPWYEFRAGLAFPRHEFQPVPDADTATLLIEPRDPSLLPWGERRGYQELVRAVFSTGHLTIDVALRAVARGGSKAWLTRGGVDGRARVKDLTADDWVSLYATRVVASRPRG